MSDRVSGLPHVFESLEHRRLLSGGGTLETPGGAPGVYPPHFDVAGQSMEQWAADWWTLIFETPVHTGTEVTHPNLDETGEHGGQGDVGDVFFLFQSFAPGEVERTVNVPAGKPILVPIMPIEFSNYDTPDPNGNFPADYSAEELEGFAGATASSIRTRGEVFASVDGRRVSGVEAHREATPVSYTLPAEDNLLQFFGLPFSGPVAPASVDGYFIMLQPLALGQHEIVFGGTIPTNPAPVLSDFSVTVTYTVNVVPAAGPTAVPQAGGTNLFGQERIQPTRIVDLIQADLELV